MATLTQKEIEAILTLLKDFTNYYNAHQLSKHLKISHAGAQKLCKRLEKENLLLAKKIGRSIIYKINIKDEYTQALLTFLLIDEANEFKRWREEFRSFFKDGRIIVFFGSAVKNYERASDIDLMLILPNKRTPTLDKNIKEKQKILPKQLHTIKLTTEEFISNARKHQEAVINVIRNGIVIHGQKEYVEALNHVTSG
ncbi:hypothetical protein CL622_07975 [archaeon]|nr:hypothetical protein [archaeon]|tara:strand:+ start:859 stop:1449 length:591 start_codon:yes stop_codon:yes gene_type:complete